MMCAACASSSRKWRECYHVLGIVHTLWRPIPGEFDDYIAVPKDNLYQSLHTAVICLDGKPLEVQIRTEEMHQVAEYGIAAHWRYKEGPKRDLNVDAKVAWLRQATEWREDIDDPRQFVDSMKSDVFADRVYVFTPKGDIVDLPQGATPVDFAYEIHSEIGYRCRGAKVDGRLVSLDYQLRSGEQVEILTAKQAGPSRDWLNPHLNYVATQRARQKIRQWFRRQEREQNIVAGREALDREMHRLGLEPAVLLPSWPSCSSSGMSTTFWRRSAMAILVPAQVANKIDDALNKSDETLKAQGHSHGRTVGYPGGRGRGLAHAHGHLLQARAGGSDRGLYYAGQGCYGTSGRLLQYRQPQGHGTTHRRVVGAHATDVSRGGAYRGF